MDLSLSQTWSRRWPRATAVCLALIASAIAAGPVAAGPGPWHTSVAKCRYEANPAGERVLKKIVVTPPELYARVYRQTVGWRFVVRRSLNRDAGPWNTTYRSPIQTAVATRSEPGAFAPMSVKVHVPDVGDKSAIRYHVTLKMRWYRSNGTVEVGEDYEFDVMKWYSNGRLEGTDDYCPAILATGP